MNLRSLNILKIGEMSNMSNVFKGLLKKFLKLGNVKYVKFVKSSGKSGARNMNLRAQHLTCLRFPSFKHISTKPFNISPVS